MRLLIPLFCNSSQILNIFKLPKNFMVPKPQDVKASCYLSGREIKIKEASFILHIMGRTFEFRPRPVRDVVPATNC